MKTPTLCFTFALLALSGALGQVDPQSLPPPAPPPERPPLPEDIARVVRGERIAPVPPPASSTPRATPTAQSVPPAAAQTATGVDAAGVAIRFDPVTEAEYEARETARPPVAPAAPSDGRRIVRTDAELRAALLTPGEIVVPGITLTVSSRIVNEARGIWLHGNGLANSKLILAPTSTDDRLVHPKAADFTISDLTLSSGSRQVFCIHMDGFSRGADRLTIERVQIESCSHAIWLSGGPCTNPSDILEDFTFRGSRIVDFHQGGIFLSWELLRPRITDFVISGKGAGSAFNGIWIGLGVVDGVITNGLIEKVNRIGLEAFYPHGTTTGGPAVPLVTKNNPNGAGMSFDNLVVADTGSMGFSFAGCKRGNIGAITTRNATQIGVEFVDQDKTRSDYNVSGPVTVINPAGLGISVDQIRSARLSGILVNGVRSSPAHGTHFGMQVYLSDDITVTDSTFSNCGPRYILHNQSTRCHYRDNYFVPQPNESWPDPEGGNFAWYGYGGDAYFHGNTMRGNKRTAFNACATTTSPTSGVMPGPDPAYPTYWQSFIDPNNYRAK